MSDFSIKDKCERCGATENLDGVIQPCLVEGKLVLDNATLCPPCYEDYKKYVADHKDELM